MAHLQGEGYRADTSPQQQAQPAHQRHRRREPPQEPADLQQTLAFLGQLSGGALGTLSGGLLLAHLGSSVQTALKLCMAGVGIASVAIAVSVETSRFP